MPVKGKKISEVIEDTIKWFGEDGVRWARGALFTGPHGVEQDWKSLRPADVQYACILGGIFINSPEGCDSPYKGEDLREVRRILSECVPDLGDKAGPVSDPTSETYPTDKIVTHNDSRALDYKTDILPVLVCARDNAIALGD